MSDRKNYSKRRESAIYGIIHEEIMQLRIAVLKGLLNGYSDIGKEEQIDNKLLMLGDKVCAEYRKSYAKDSK